MTNPAITLTLQLKDWKTSPDLFPVDVSAKAKGLIDAAVKACVKDWGELAPSLVPQLPPSMTISLAGRLTGHQ